MKIQIFDKNNCKIIDCILKNGELYKHMYDTNKSFYILNIILNDYIRGNYKQEYYKNVTNVMEEYTNSYIKLKNAIILANIDFKADEVNYIIDAVDSNYKIMQRVCDCVAKFNNTKKTKLF